MHFEKKKKKERLKHAINLIHFLSIPIQTRTYTLLLIVIDEFNIKFMCESCYLIDARILHILLEQ